MKKKHKVKGTADLVKKFEQLAKQLMKREKKILWVSVIASFYNDNKKDTPISVTGVTFRNEI
jgi:hypothetical protein